MWRLPVLALATLAPACTWVSNRPDVLFTTDPPGAHIWVDGEDTGHTTPHKMALGNTFGSNHEVVLKKKGYRPVRRRLYQHTEGYTSQWIDGAYDVSMPPLPLFWTIGDFIFPFGMRSAIVPGELHAKLYGEDEPRLGFELLQDREPGATDDTLLK